MDCLLHAQIGVGKTNTHSAGTLFSEFDLEHIDGILVLWVRCFGNSHNLFPGFAVWFY